MKLNREPRPLSDPTTWGADCDNCPLGYKREKAVPPKFHANPKLIIIAEAPGRNEEAEGEPLIGASGDLLSKLLKKYGADLNTEIHKTNAICCLPDEKLEPAEWRAAIKACKPRLVQELEAVDCNTILALGGKAQLTVNGKAKIFDWCGTPYNDVTKEFEGYKTLSTFHPAYALRVPPYRVVMAIHIQRALLLAEDKLPKFQWPQFSWGTGDDVMSGLRRIAARGELACIDVETAPRSKEQKGPQPQFDHLLNVGIADQHDMVSIDWPNAGPAEKRLIQAIAEDPAHPLTFQNAPYDILALSEQGIVVAGFDHDTLGSHPIIAPGMRHGLSIQGAIVTHAERWKTIFGSGKDDSSVSKFVSADPKERALYNARDCYISVLCALYNKQALNELPRGWEVYNRRHKLIEIAIKMMKGGIRVDTSKFARHRKELAEAKADAKETFLTLANQVTDRLEQPALTSPTKRQECCKLFFDYLGIKPTKFSKKTGAPSLDANTLKRLLGSPNKTAAALARELLRYRKYEKLLSTYIDGLPLEFPYNDGVPYIFPVWKPGGARTGRWASKAPNFMNVPKGKYIVDRKTGKKKMLLPNMRDIFRVSKDENWLVAADYQKLELMIIALLSGAKNMLEAFNEGRDIHDENTKLIFGVDDFTEAQRTLGKNVIYGSNYLGSVDTIHATLIKEFPQTRLKHVQRIMDNWFKAQPEIPKWHREQISFAYKHGYIVEPFSGIMLKFWDDQFEPSKIVNHPIQTFAGWLINMAAIGIAEELDWSRERIWAQIHDELVLEGPDPVRLASLLKKHMEQVITWLENTVTFKIDFQIGKNQGELQKAATLEDVRKVAEGWDIKKVVTND